MKKVFVFWVLAALALAGAIIAADRALAGEMIQPQLDVAQDCESAIEQTVAARAAPVAVAMSVRSDLAAGDPPVMAASCASNEWCCKHDIGGTGACTKCCPK